MAIKPLAFYVGAAVATAAVLAGVNYGRWSKWQPPVTASGPAEVKITSAPQPVKQPEQAAEQPAKQPEQAPEQTAEQPEQTAPKQAEQQPSQPAQQQSAMQAGQQPAPQQPAQESAAQPAEPQKQAAVEPPAPPVPAEETPSFDIVRVEPDGSTVVAGRSPPGADIVLKLDSQVIGRAEATPRGEWVIVPDQPIARGDHQLTLEATDPDGKVVVSQQAVIIKVPESGQQNPLIVLAEPQKPSQVLQTPETTGKTVVAEKETAQPSSEQTAEQAPAKAAEEAAAKKAAERATAKATEEAATGAAKDVTASRAAEATARKALGLGSVDYDDKGNMIFAGNAVPGSTVRLYVDNGFLGDAAADAAGNWTFSGQERIAAGDHRLRVDSVGADGRVMARIEVPFTRAGEEEVAALQKSRQAEQQAPAKTESETTVPAMSGEKAAEAEMPATAREPAMGEQGAGTGQPAGTGEPARTEAPAGQQAAVEQKAAPSSEEMAQPPASRSGRVVIQPGNNLWRIARIIYGHGTQYTVIYQANKSDIRDPDLIYPGQIFTTPGVVPPKYIDPRRRRPLTPEERAAAEAAAAAEQ